jgi:hypothetical protein
LQEQDTSEDDQEQHRDGVEPGECGRRSRRAAAKPYGGTAGSKRLDVSVGAEVNRLGAIAAFVGRTLAERSLERSL